MGDIFGLPRFRPRLKREIRLGLCGKPFLHEWRPDASWTNAVYADLVLREFHSRSSCHVDDRGLRARIREGSVSAGKTGNRGGVDDGAARTAVQHGSGAVLDAEKHALH